MHAFGDSGEVLPEFPGATPSLLGWDPQTGFPGPDPSVWAAPLALGSFPLRPDVVVMVPRAGVRFAGRGVPVLVVAVALRLASFAPARCVALRHQAVQHLGAMPWRRRCPARLPRRRRCPARLPRRRQCPAPSRSWTARVGARTTPWMRWRPGWSDCRASSECASATSAALRPRIQPRGTSLPRSPPACTDCRWCRCGTASRRSVWAMFVTHTRPTCGPWVASLPKCWSGRQFSRPVLL